MLASRMIQSHPVITSSPYINLAATSMPEDVYVTDDEETSAELGVQQFLDPVPVSYPTQQSDVDDMFEGEPDSSLFESPDSEHAENVLGRTACGEAEAGQDCIDLDQQPQMFLMASGVLGRRDSPYDRILHKKSYPEVATEVETLGRKSEEPEKHSSNISYGLQHRAEQHRHQRSDWWLPYLESRNALRQREERLEELSGETFGKLGHETRIYSSSASSETVSDMEDEYHVQPGSEEDKQKDTTWTLPFTHKDEQTEPFKAANLVQEDKAQSESRGNDRDESTRTRFKSGNTHPSVLHSWTHLSEVTPADVQGHHPSVIPRSPRKGTSRASSLASEVGPDTAEKLQPLTEAALLEKNSLITTEDSKIFRRPVSPTKLAPLLCPVPDKGLSSPFRRSQLTYSTSSSRSSPLRPPADSTDTASLSAVTGSPMPLLSAVPSRPDTPRPSAGLEMLGASDRSNIQPASSHVSTPNRESHRALHSCRNSLDEWGKSGCNTHVAVSAAALSGSAFASSIVNEQPAQDTSQNVTETISQLVGDATKATTSPSISSLRSQTTGTDLPSVDVPWQEPRIISDVLDCHPSRAQSENSSRAPLHSEAGIYLEPSARESTGIDRRPSDPFARGKDFLHSAAPPAEHPPPSSPLAGLQNAIQAKRGSRKATVPKRKGVKELMGTRGRAVSFSPKKDKTRTIASNALVTGVQGEDNKVTKTRAKKPARATSWKASTSKDKKKSIEDDVPEVPDLPEDMLLGFPNIHPRPVRLYISEQRCKMPDTSTTRKSTARLTSIKTATGIDERNNRGDNSPQTDFKDQVSPPSTHEQQLKVSKTRKSIKSGTAAASEKTTPYQIKMDTMTATAQTPEHNRMNIDTVTPSRESSLLQHEIQKLNRPNEPRTSPTKNRAARKSTPGAIQKSTVRKHRTPARLPTHRPDQIVNLLETWEHVEQHEKSTQTSPTKTNAAPRKATPAPRKRKQENKISGDVVPPVPKTPKRSNKNAEMGAGGRLTPQSAEVGQPKTPLRRSPRLSGIEPGLGL